MFSEFKVTEIYCMADDFCKEFTWQQGKYMVEDKMTRYRDNPNRLSDVEIMVIFILSHSSGSRCFKHYHKEYVCKYLKLKQGKFLKDIAQIEHSRHRPFSNFIANSLSAIVAYCFF